MHNQQLATQLSEGNLAQMTLDMKGEGAPADSSEVEQTSQSSDGVGKTPAPLPAQDDDTTAISILEDATRVKDIDTPINLARKIRNAGQEYFGRRLLLTERAEGTLPQRSKQAILHVHFTEGRIAELETELRRIKKDIYGSLEDTLPLRRKNMHYVYQHAINRVDTQAFRITTRTFEVPIERRPVLEISFPGLMTQRDTGSLHRQNAGLPNRIRVRSRSLLAHLQRITGISSQFNLLPPNYGEKENQSAAVFLRPFKQFVCYDQEIKKSLLELEAKVADKDPRPESQDDASRQVSELKNFRDEDLLEDLKLLVEILEVDLKPVFDLRKQIKAATATEIEYDDLWHLFTRGEMVLSHSNQSHAYRVVNYTGGREPLVDRLGLKDEKIQPVDGLTVDCLSIEFDGLHYVPKLEKISIRRYHGKRPITSLPVYPLKLHPNVESLTSQFREQGKLFLSLNRRQFCHKLISGRTLGDPPQDIDAQVIVDNAMALNLNPDWQPDSKITDDSLTRSDKRETRIPAFCHHNRVEEGCCGGDFADKDLELDQEELSKYFQTSKRILAPRREEELDEEELMLLPHWVYGFVLRSRKWVKLRTADLSNVIFENDFRALLLPEHQKNMIRALVATHENSGSNKSLAGRTVGGGIDIVKGKGTGLIILLHGEPGVGKTSTAECVADETERPLFPITCGDIGETAVEVETNLHKNFNLAQRWGCVLLLDEADVFLAKRNRNELRQNAVTSIFLRSLEYYSGILFLTSNRVGGIDPAFKSRIHLSVYYPRLSMKATRKLYKVFIKRVQAEQERADVFSFRIKKQEILQFAENHFRQMENEGLATWNGRQIRNVFQAAVALAEYGNQNITPGQRPATLGESQFQVVAESSKEFDRYLRSVLLGAEADVAFRDNWRNDEYFDARAADAPGSKTTHDTKFSGRENSRDSESDDSTNTDSDEEEDDSSDDEKALKSTKAAGKQASTPAQREAPNPQEATEYEKFQAFLRWSNSQK